MSVSKFHENPNDIVKTWTIRKIDTETIEKTKAAAGKSGMKIGAWVDAKLSEAADASLQNNTKLSKEIDQIAEDLDSNSSTTNSKVAKLEQDIAQLIKGQHNIFLALEEIRKQSLGQ